MSKAKNITLALYCDTHLIKITHLGVFHAVIIFILIPKACLKEHGCSRATKKDIYLEQALKIRTVCLKM